MTDYSETVEFGIVRSVTPVPIFGTYLGWTNCSQVSVQYPPSQDEYAVRIDVPYRDEMNPDFSDLRFTNLEDEGLYYWMESYVESVSAVVWVKIGKGATLFNLLYGNTSAVSESDGNNVFEFFDDFFGVVWHNAPSPAGAITLPHGVAADTEGNVYAVNTVLNQIQKFDQYGISLKTWGIAGTGNGEFGGNEESTGPMGIAIDRTVVTPPAPETYDEWSTVAKVNVTNAPALDAYPIRLYVPFATGMKEDFGDLRFTDLNDQALPYWIESYTTGPGVNVWVKVAAGTTSFLMVYGYASATSESNGANVFDLYDGFESGTIDAAKWDTSTGGATVQGGLATITGDGTGYKQITSLAKFGQGYALRASANIPASDRCGLGWTPSPYGYPLSQVYFGDPFAANYNLRDGTDDAPLLSAVVMGDTWTGTHLYDIARHAGSTVCTVDNGTTYTHSANLTATALGVGILSRLDTISVQADYFIVRKCSATEPACTIEAPAPNVQGAAVTNNVYVADTINNRIQKFTSEGIFISSFGVPGTGNGQFNYPTGIAVDGSGYVYVVDSKNARVQKFTSAGTFVTKWGSAGTGNGQFNLHYVKDSGGVDVLIGGPWGIAVDSSGNVYVGDTYNNRIQKFSSTGTFISAFGQPVSEETAGANGYLRCPMGVAVDASNNLYVVNSESWRMDKFDSAGTWILRWGGWGSADGKFLDPYGIAVAPDGSVYVADTWNNRLQKFSPLGALVIALDEDKWTSAGTVTVIHPAATTVPAPTAEQLAGQVLITGGTSNIVSVPTFGIGTAMICRLTPPATPLVNLGYHNSVGGSTEYAVIYQTSGQTLRGQAGSGGSWSDGVLTSTAVAGTPYGFEISRKSAAEVLCAVNRTDANTIAVQCIPTIALPIRVNGFVGTTAVDFVAVRKCSVLEPVCTVGDPTTADQFNGPVGIATDIHGNLYVVDRNNAQIRSFDSTGHPIASWGSFGTGDGQFIYPTDVAVDSVCNVYVVDAGNSRIQKFDSAGRFILKWGSAGTGPSHFSGAYGIAVNSAGNVYVTDHELNNVQMFSPQGAYMNLWGDYGTEAFNGPTGITIDSNNNVYIADSGNNRICKFTVDGVDVSTWGRAGTDEGQFAGIGMMAVDTADRVYAVDIGNHRIQKFTPNGGFLQKWGSFGGGNGRFTELAGIAVAGAAYVYVSDRLENRIQKFTSIGTFINVVNSSPADGQILFPYGVAGNDEGKVYVADTKNDRVQVFDPAGGYLSKWGSFGAGIGQFNWPEDLAIDHGDNVYVCDTGNNRIQKFTKDGVFKLAWGERGTFEGQFNNPTAIAVDVSGNVYVVDTGNNRVQKFAANGTYISTIGLLSAGGSLFDSPSGIAVDNQDNIYVGDTNGHRFVKFNHAGTFLYTIGSAGTGDGQFLGALSLTTDSANNVYVCDAGNYRVQKFTSAGTFVTKWGSFGAGTGQFSTPFGIALDDAGNILVADTRNHRIQKFTPAGRYLLSIGTHIYNDQITESSDVIAATGYHETVEFGVEREGEESQGAVVLMIPSSKQISTSIRRGSADLYTTCTETVNGAWDASTDEYYYPYAVTTSEAGYLCVADTGNNRIHLTGLDGKNTAIWGGIGSGVGQFRNPYGIAALSGGVYVTDYSNNRVQYFLYTGEPFLQWGTVGTGDGQFNGPWGIVTDTLGTVYVVDSGNARVQVFDSAGTFIRKWGTAGTGDGQFGTHTIPGSSQIVGPSEIAIDSAGNIYVLDSDNNRVQVFDSAGTFIRKWGTAGTGDGQFNGPWGLAVGLDDHVYVADTLNNRIQKFTSAGVYVSEWGSKGPADGQFSWPTGITTDTDGNVYVVDTQNCRIQKFDSTGRFISTWGVEGTGTGQFPTLVQMGTGKDKIERCMFYGIIPDQDYALAAFNNTTQIKAFDLGWMLTQQYVPTGNMIARMEFNPSNYIKVLLGGGTIGSGDEGTQWNTLTRIRPYRINPIPKWGETATLWPDNPVAPYPQITPENFEFTETTFAADAVKRIEDKSGMIFLIKTGVPAGSGSGHYEARAYFVHENDIDSATIGLDLPAEALFRGLLDPGVIAGTYPLSGDIRDGITVTQRTGVKYNRITVFGQTADETPIQLTGFAELSAVTEKLALPLEYRDPNKTLTTQAAVDARARALLLFYQADHNSYRAVVMNRLDLELYQLVRFKGWANVPEFQLRIIEIEYHLENANNYVSITLIPAQMFLAQRQLARMVIPSQANNTITIVQKALSEQLSNQVGTVVSASGSVAVVKLENGTTVEWRCTPA